MYDAIIFSECNGTIGWGRDSGAYTVTSQLRRAGYRVKTIDFFSHFDFTRFKTVVDNFVSKQTSFLGFSSTHCSNVLPSDLDDYWLKQFDRDTKNANWNVYFPFDPDNLDEWFNYAKSKYPQLKIVMGGQKVSQKVALQKKYPMVDIWIGGMADVSVVKLMDELKTSVDVRRHVKSELHYPTYKEEDFNHSSILWHKEDDTIFQHEVLPLEIARKCPFNCAFCDYPKKNRGQWIKTADTLRNELMRNYDQFGTTKYAIMDYQVNESVEKMRMVHRVFKSVPFDITWAGFCRLEMVNLHPEMIDLIYDSGGRSIMWGIETINPETGRLIGKNTKLNDIESILGECHEKWGNRVITGSGFILGLPNETLETCYELLDWIENQSYLNGWEICPLFIGGYEPKKEYTIEFSKIQKEPEKYGYDVVLEKRDNRWQEYWTHNDLSKQKVIDIINESYNVRSKTRRSLITYHGYIRCMNLGFKHDDLLNVTRSNTDFLKEYIKRYKALANLYLERNGLNGS